jgi:HK97 family phage portal protein
LKLEPLSYTADDAALIETRTFNVEDIARFFNIPVSLLTENNQNAEAVMLQFLTQTLSPYIVLFEDELNRKLIHDDDFYFDFDERALIRVDMKSTAMYLKTLVESAIISVNEARELLGLPLKEDGDTLSRPYTDVQQNLVAGKS